jgi:hypothetical protein
VAVSKPMYDIASSNWSFRFSSLKFIIFLSS